MTHNNPYIKGVSSLDNSASLSFNIIIKWPFQINISSDYELGLALSLLDIYISYCFVREYEKLTVIVMNFLSLYKVIKLKGAENYDFWKEEMQSLLTLNKLWLVIIKKNIISVTSSDAFIKKLEISDQKLLK